MATTSELDAIVVGSGPNGLAAAVARAIEGHDCTRRAPQVRPWVATAADKASSARTRVELHELASSQPVRAKKPPLPSADACSATAGRFLHSQAARAPALLPAKSDMTEGGL